MNTMLDYNENKAFRLLSVYERLNKGELLNKSQLAETFHVSEKTIQRDIDDLRCYLAERHEEESEVLIRYNKSKNGYYLVKFEREWLTNEEVLALCKILLESRAFKKQELDQLLEKLTAQVFPEDRKNIERIISNEHFHYVPLQHNKELLTPIWELSQYILNHEIISFSYTRKDNLVNERVVKPVAIMFSEYYFYLIAFMADDTKEFPTVFRIDRMQNIKNTKQKFEIPYRNKFNDGEFRKRVQFMYSGELRKVEFEYSGPSIEAVLDRLPTAEIINQDDGVFTVKAEAYGNGIDMWLRSQGDRVKVLSG